MIEDLIHWNEGRIDKWIKSSQEYLEANTKETFIMVRDLIVNTVRNVILPIIMDFVWNRRFGGGVAAQEGV